MNALIEAVKKVSFFVASVAAILLGIMLFLNNGDSLGRYFLNMPIKGTLEFSEIVIVVLIFLPLAYCEMTKGHIKLTLITDKLSEGKKRILNYFNTVVACIYVALLFWFSLKMAIQAFVDKEFSNGSIAFPLFPGKLAVAIGALLLLFFLIIKLRYTSNDAKEELK